jgi:hypothetical protein
MRTPKILLSLALASLLTGCIGTAIGVAAGATVAVVKAPFQITGAVVGAAAETTGTVIGAPFRLVGAAIGDDDDKDDDNR